MRHSRLIVLGLTAVAGVASPAFAGAQSVQDILETAMQKYQERAASIDNYTVVQEVIGVDVTMYFEKEMIDGRPVFVSRSVSAGGQSHGMSSNDVVADLASIVESASYAGRQEVGGRTTHAIRVDEAGLVGWSGSVAPNTGGFEAKSMTLFFDDRDYVLRRVLVDGEIRQDGQTRPTTSTIDFTDYRTVDGLLHPFTTTFSIEGMMGPGQGMSEKDIEEARKQLADFDRQMAEMPESQRAMMQRMMGGRIDQLREMLESGGTSFKVEVKEVRVNAGPPGAP